jgi:Putative zinc-finger
LRSAATSSVLSDVMLPRSNRAAPRTGVRVDAQRRRGHKETCAEMGQHRQADGAGAHDSSQLEDYVLGRLSKPAEFAVEAHLLRCPQCRSECERLSEMVAMVATLPPAVVDSIEDTTQSARLTLRRGVALVAALVLGVVLGAGGWMLAAPASLRGVPVGSDSQDGAAGRLSVTVSMRTDGGIDVRAVAVGLRPGLGYELIAVAGDGRNYGVARGVAAGGPQTILGNLPIAASNVRFFAVIQPDGRRLLVAFVP